MHRQHLKLTIMSAASEREADLRRVCNTRVRMYIYIYIHSHMWTDRYFLFPLSFPLQRRFRIKCPGGRITSIPLNPFMPESPSILKTGLNRVVHVPFAHKARDLFRITTLSPSLRSRFVRSQRNPRGAYHTRKIQAVRKLGDVSHYGLETVAVSLLIDKSGCYCRFASRRRNIRYSEIADIFASDRTLEDLHKIRILIATINRWIYRSLKFEWRKREKGIKRCKYVSWKIPQTRFKSF